MMQPGWYPGPTIALINKYHFAGSGYELYDPYSGNVTVVVGPAPHYGGPGGGPPVLAAVPCQPLPLQPLEWFNPAFIPYVTAPCHNGLATARDRRKRYSTDSQVRPHFFSMVEEPQNGTRRFEYAAAFFRGFRTDTTSVCIISTPAPPGGGALSATQIEITLIVPANVFA
jgi:hypothetical protein